MTHMIRKHTLILIILVPLSFALVFSAGYLLHAIFDSEGFDFPILFQAYTLLEEHALQDRPEPPRLEYGMIRGMLQAFDDPFTNFVEPIQHEFESDNLKGSYGGIGARLGRDKDGFLVLYPFPNSPASEAGIQDGDRLTMVNDMPISSETILETALAAIRGPTGKQVVIQISRYPLFDNHKFEIRREEIPLPSVTWHIETSTSYLGIVEINLIAATTPDEIEVAISDLIEKGATHFAMDLRSNRGGLLSAGVEVARLFLSEGTVIEQKYRDEPVKSFNINRPGSFADIPLVVFIDHGTASAAEIIAGALKAHTRATLIGTHTYGKDSIQLVFDLDDGSSLHVTAAKWWLPGLDYAFSENGIQPDIHITDKESGPDPYIMNAIQHFEK